MLHYGGEWYWGADRLYHLENRLIDLGARKDDADELLCPRPEIEFGPLRDDGSLTFEIYPSLRSPYTSLIFDLAVELAERTGVRMVMRPVLPMVMRGVPATRQKGFYIFTDAAREARALGLEWGRVHDPIGNPVRNGYSLYPWAVKQGKGTELLSSFLRAAFFDGVNTNNDRGMQKVVENAGLSWEEARSVMGNRDWEDELEENRLAMYGLGLWGVPSFRLLDADGQRGARALGPGSPVALLARDPAAAAGTRRLTFASRPAAHRKEFSERTRVVTTDSCPFRKLITVGLDVCCRDSFNRLSTLRLPYSSSFSSRSSRAYS